MALIFDLLQWFFVGAYFVVLALLCVYGVHRYQLVYLYHKHKLGGTSPEAPARLPSVTVQLPVYNERYVVCRLIEAVSKLDYPPALLDIQVLDDSTDDTREIVAALVERLRVDGHDIHHLRRDGRAGFKAGALQFGLRLAKGDLIAVFDADFVPPRGLLRELVPHFDKEEVGMVQARWGYLNRGYSLLTELQAIFLDAHFAVEHLARNRSGRFFNFNGTAGLWRRDCIEAAGGWQSDTLTEDLDLSYRAQLAGWRFVFVPHIEAPSELPVEMSAFKVQQHRWAKGSLQTAFKLLGTVMRSRQPWRVKLEAVFHLTNNVSYLLLVFLSLSMLPSMIIRYNMGWWETIWIDLPLLVSATLSVTLFYLTAQRALRPQWPDSIVLIPAAMGLGIGIALNNGRAALEALCGWRSEFRRTPKYGIAGVKDRCTNRVYAPPIGFVIIGEVLMALYFALNVYFALVNEIYVALPFLVLFLFGFSYVSLLSLVQRVARLGDLRAAMRPRTDVR